MEVYATVAPYLVEFPKVKNACLKWSWKQNTSKGWCQVPPSISHILSRDSKFGMYDFIFQVEMAMGFLSKTASTVVEELKAKTKWIAEVEINIMAKIFAVSKFMEGKTVLEQVTELSQQCATLIAVKFLELLNFEFFSKLLFELFSFEFDILIFELLIFELSLKIFFIQD